MQGFWWHDRDENERVIMLMKEMRQQIEIGMREC
jgi:hypothetical protein